MSKPLVMPGKKSYEVFGEAMKAEFAGLLDLSQQLQGGVSGENFRPEEVAQILQERARVIKRVEQLISVLPAAAGQRDFPELRQIIGRILALDGATQGSLVKILEGVEGELARMHQGQAGVRAYKERAVRGRPEPRFHDRMT